MPVHANQIPVALSIAGSDPSGGAGIQADIKTFTVLGIYCGAAITALTTQNTLGVSSYMPLPPDFVKKQVKDVLDDLLVTHIKIGMVGSAGVADTLCGILRDFKGEIIYDPVSGSSSGDSLVMEKNYTAIKRLAGHCTVLTPNIGELEILSGRQCPDQDCAVEAAKTLFTAYPRLKAVCLTGGHLNMKSDTVTDFLLQPAPGKTKKGESHLLIQTAHHPRISSNNTHGTGCSFASAFTAYLLKTNNLYKSFVKASSFLDRLISKSAGHHIGQGTGPLLHHLMIR
ncbi:MAG: bifunctional hydroxymethylpyrimidine kinase/phosphomethylpyrimidine kinase [Pseudomonadota bacterium]